MLLSASGAADGSPVSNSSAALRMMPGETGASKHRTLTCTCSVAGYQLATLASALGSDLPCKRCPTSDRDVAQASAHCSAGWMLHSS